MTQVLATAQGIGSTASLILPSRDSINQSFVTDWLLGVGGDFGGTADVTIDYSPDSGSTWIELSGVTFSAAGTKNLQLPFQAEIRLTVTGGTSPSINAWIN